MSRILTFSVVMRRNQALTRMLMLVERLGGKLTYLSAVDKRATLVIEASSAIAHRFGPQIRRMLDVTELIELRRCGEAGTAVNEDSPDGRTARAVRDVA